MNLQDGLSCFIMKVQSVERVSVGTVQVRSSPFSFYFLFLRRK
jgi:hypothetical protein